MFELMCYGVGYVARFKTGRVSPKLQIAVAQWGKYKVMRFECLAVLDDVFFCAAH